MPEILPADEVRKIRYTAQAVADSEPAERGPGSLVHDLLAVCDSHQQLEGERTALGVRVQEAWARIELLEAERDDLRAKLTAGEAELEQLREAAGCAAQFLGSYDAEHTTLPETLVELMHAYAEEIRSALASEPEPDTTTTEVDGA